MKVSIVVPVFNDLDYLLELLDSLIKQTKKPQEIVIIDSSIECSQAEISNKLKNEPIKLVYKNIKPSYAGKSLNLGINLASNKIIGFLDTKTIPRDSWVEHYLGEMEMSGCDVIFGLTSYEALHPFQKILKAASYGNIGHESVPGTMIKREFIQPQKSFREDLRAAYDLEWREEVKGRTNWLIPTNSLIVHSKLPTSIFESVKKYFIYAFHTAKARANTDLKQIYFSLFLLLTAILVPKWNQIVAGWEWEQSPFYIADITKIYILSILILLLLMTVLKRLFPQENQRPIFYNVLSIIVLIFVSLSIYNWNEVLANWVETAVLYVPHITKIYIFLIISFSLVYRGLYRPIKWLESREYLFPFNWIRVGLLGLLLDFTKAPGYVLGAFIELFKPTYNVKK